MHPIFQHRTTLALIFLVPSLASALTFLFTQIYGYTKKEEFDLCDSTIAEEFATQFKNVISTPEACSGKCQFGNFFWDKPINIAIYSSPSVLSQKYQIKQFLEDASTLLQQLIGQEVSIFTDDDFAQFANLFVIILDNGAIEAFESGSLVSIISPEEFAPYKNMALKGACTTHVAISNDTIPAIAEYGVIFVPPNLPEGQLETCIYEEFINTLGLIGDPREQASLFDGNNFRLTKGQLNYSLETLAMLDALYSISSNRIANIDEYITNSCNNN